MKQNKAQPVSLSFILGYTRSRETGEILNYHRKDIANTIHGSTGMGGNTDQFVAEIYEND